MNSQKKLPPTYFIILLIISLFLHFLLPIYEIILYPYNLIGVLFVVFGIILNLKADAHFKKANTTVKPFEKSSVLIMYGVFRFSRHPMYLGMACILIGIAILLGSLSTFISPVIFILIIQQRFIQMEEKMMLDTFKHEYKKYQSEVRKWI